MGGGYSVSLGVAIRLGPFWETKKKSPEPAGDW
jgi:hypothetical protein